MATFSLNETNNALNTIVIDTLLGPVIAIANDEALVLLEFKAKRKLERELERLQKHFKTSIIPKENKILSQIRAEVDAYFSGTLKVFCTPMSILGSPFQQNVWKSLMKIPYGETRSYLEQAHQINYPKAFRAVANANGANQLSIIIPCHRIINHNGKLGGYGAGLERKEWLLKHEKENKG